jgi:CO/xanthine dehydrogenase Mo-binding subunit
MVPTAPAMANAICDALGIRFTELPISAEKIYMAYQSKRDE